MTPGRTHMKLWIRNICLCVSTIAFAAACEPGAGGESDATDGSTSADMTDSADNADMSDGVDMSDSLDMSDGLDMEDSTDATDDTVIEYPVIEFEDNENNPTLGENCDPGGGIESPGADIDAASLEASDGTLLGYLAGCSVLNPGSCENDNASAANAEGEPDLPNGEVLDTYTSLNGGLMRCGWEGGITAQSGDVVTVYEVGKATGTTVETYAVRLCMSVGGNCTFDKTELTGEASFNVDELLQ